MAKLGKLVLWSSKGHEQILLILTKAKLHLHNVRSFRKCFVLWSLEREKLKGKWWASLVWTICFLLQQKITFDVQSFPSNIYQMTSLAYNTLRLSLPVQSYMCTGERWTPFLPLKVSKKLNALVNNGRKAAGFFLPPPPPPGEKLCTSMCAVQD